MVELPAIEYTPAAPCQGQRIYTQMRREVEWMLILGWKLERKPDGVHLTHRGQKKIVRGGALIDG